MIEMKTKAPTGFHRFGLHESLNRGIADLGFADPRPIQAATIPAGLAGRDVLGLAQTGTGKTAAFALPILQRLLGERHQQPGALVLAPTRELATQISKEFQALARFTSLKVVTIFGGVAQSGQVRALRQSPDIVVGCPGRVLDLVQQKLLRLDQVETLVLDEADHMFDMGFLPGIRQILAALPARRQNLLFSATMPREVRRLADDLLRDPQVAELALTGPAATIDHALVLVPEDRKRDLLEHVLTNEGCSSAIVFTRTKHRARRLADQLCKAGYRAVGLQGNLSQSQRDRAMHGFRNHRFDILVATDIVARGIDVSGVSHVINFDVPNTPEAYTHRIGRTGRSEHEGIACTFVTGSDHGWLRATERMIGAPIQRRLIAGFEADVELPEAPPPSRRGQGGSRNQQPAQQYSAGPRSGGRTQADGRNQGGSPAQGRSAGSGRSRRRRRTG